LVREGECRTGRGRLTAAVAVFAIALGLVLAGPQLASGAPTPPPNPSDSQLNAARDAKQGLATRVGALSGQIAQANIQLQQLQGRAELAEQKYALAYSQWQIAEQKATRAKAQLVTARHSVVDAHARFVEYVQASYMSGDVTGATGTLLTASDPSALLEQSALEQYQQQHQADAVGALQGASVAVSNADARARLAVAAAKVAKANADTKRREAHQAVLVEQAQRVQLQNSMAATQNELDTARLQLATLNQQRSVYIAYQAEQIRLARIRHERLLRHLAHLRFLQQQQQQQQQSGGGGGGGGGGSGPPAPSGGNWTASKGRHAAQRAISQLGWSYAWAGGGAFGPSQGVCDPSNGAPNDCHVVGYDCSGLAMYAWGGSWWAHYAATQFRQAGSFHPSAGQLRPGDLIFWSFNGAVSGIHHVAVYVGSGHIVEAPYSGGFVQEASLYEYGGFFGATRPLT
jgi:cell wall-associated NlpC family hydrolase